MVQETFLNAIKNLNFECQSSPRTWLISILKHKIIDSMRKNREMVASDLIDYSDNYSANDFFNASGNWIDKLKNGSA